MDAIKDGRHGASLMDKGAPCNSIRARRVRLGQGHDSRHEARERTGKLFEGTQRTDLAGTDLAVHSEML